MPINSINGPATGPQTQRSSDGAQVQVGRGEPSSAQQETGTSSTADTVSLTPAAQQLRSLENTISQLPVEDPRRVESIQQALVDGSEKVESATVADKMLALESKF